jgi:hypothetical protein
LEAAEGSAASADDEHGWFVHLDLSHNIAVSISAHPTGLKYVVNVVRRLTIR